MFLGREEADAASAARNSAEPVRRGGSKLRAAPPPDATPETPPRGWRAPTRASSGASYNSSAVRPRRTAARVVRVVEAARATARAHGPRTETGRILPALRDRLLRRRALPRGLPGHHDGRLRRGRDGGGGHGLPGDRGPAARTAPRDPAGRRRAAGR